MSKTLYESQRVFFPPRERLRTRLMTRAARPGPPRCRRVCGLQATPPRPAAPPPHLASGAAGRSAERRCQVLVGVGGRARPPAPREEPCAALGLILPAHSCCRRADVGC